MHSFIRLIAASLFAFMLLATPAAAQSGKPPQNYTEAEKTGFAFYRLANKNPPLEKWVRSDDKYIFARPAQKNTMLRDEIERLTRGLNNYSINEDLVLLRTTVEVYRPTPQEMIPYERQGIARPLKINLREIRENYFPVQIGGMWIAIVADGLDDYLMLNPDEDEYNRLLREFGLEIPGVARRFTMELRLRPRAVDLTAPLPLDGIDAWLMLADIGTISIWKRAGQNSEQMIWERSQSWYVPREQRALMDLYVR